MINVNLYKKKKPKLKLTTTLFLILILLLPVAGFRITLSYLKNMEMQKIMAAHTHSAQILLPVSNMDYSVGINSLKGQDELITNQTLLLQNESRILENSFVYNMITREFFVAFSESYQKYKAEDRVFIDTLLIEKKNKIEIDLYDIPLQEGVSFFPFHEEFMSRLEKTIAKPQNQVNQISFINLSALKSKITLDTSKY